MGFLVGIVRIIAAGVAEPHHHHLDGICEIAVVVFWVSCYKYMFLVCRPGTGTWLAFCMC